MQDNGMLIVPETLPLMYQHKYELACLQDDSANWCLVEDQNLVGSDIKRYPSDLCATGEQPPFSDTATNHLLGAFVHGY